MQGQKSELYWETNICHICSSADLEVIGTWGDTEGTSWRNIVLRNLFSEAEKHKKRVNIGGESRIWEHPKAEGPLVSHLFTPHFLFSSGW